MTFLQLCQRAVVECGVSGTISFVTGQTGSLGRIVNWVAEAWLDIQVEHDDWDWMRAPLLSSGSVLTGGFAFQTVAGQWSYPIGNGAGTVGIGPTRFGNYDRWSFRCSTTAQGFLDETQFGEDIPYQAWRDGYMLGANRLLQTRPTVVAIGSDQSLNLGPPPNGLYTITGDFFVSPTRMVMEPDVPPGLPDRYHMLIVYGAMRKYAGYEAASEVMERGTREYTRMMRHLEVARLPRMDFAGALA